MKKCYRALSLLVLPVARYTEIYKCTMPDGSIEYSQKKCKAGQQDTVELRINEPDPTAKENNTTKANFSIPVYPSATLKSKDDSYDGIAIFYQYRANGSFESVKAYYLKDAGEENCSSPYKSHLNCRYNNLLGIYNSGQVAVTKHAKWVKITIGKYK